MIDKVEEMFSGVKGLGPVSFNTEGIEGPRDLNLLSPLQNFRARIVTAHPYRVLLEIDLQDTFSQ